MRVDSAQGTACLQLRREVGGLHPHYVAVTLPPSRIATRPGVRVAPARGDHTDSVMRSDRPCGSRRPSGRTSVPAIVGPPLGILEPGSAGTWGPGPVLRAPRPGGTGSPPAATEAPPAQAEHRERHHRPAIQSTHGPPPRP
jgi:hypothetical protein